MISVEHGGDKRRSGWEDRKCARDGCDRVIAATKYRRGQGHGKFCSPECRYGKRAVKTCPYCGVRYEVKPSHEKVRKFCSRYCRGKGERRAGK